MQTQEFMTKTEYRKRDNGNPSDHIYLIAMDIGYSAVKVFSPETVAMFPSYAIKDSGNGTAGTMTTDYIRYENLDTGEKWFVGNMAQDGLSDDDTSVSETALYGRDRYNDPMFAVIAETGLGLACMHSGGIYKNRTICLETGLPPRYISKGSPDERYLTELLSGTHRFSLTLGQEKPMIFELTIDAENVHILPQPMGTLFSVAVDSNHQFLPEAGGYFNKNVLIFDGGFGTLDFYSIKAHVIGNSETYNNLGMKRVLAETASVIREQYQKDISIPAMQKYLAKGTFRYFDHRNIATRDEPLGEILEQCSRKVCAEAIEKMMQVYHLYEYDYLIITGGTGAAWAAQIREYLKNMTTLTIVDGAQNDTLPGVYANVRGYYMYRYSTIAAKEKTKKGGA